MATVSCRASQHAPDAITVVEFLERIFIPQRLDGRPRQYIQQFREAAGWVDRLVAPRSATLADLAGETLVRLQAFIVGQGYSASRAAGVKRLLSILAKCAWRLGVLADWRPTASIAKGSKAARPSFRDASPPDGTLAHVLANVVMPRIEADRAAKRRYVSAARRNSIAAAVQQFDDCLGRYATPADLTDANRTAFGDAIAARCSESTRRTYWRSLRTVARIVGNTGRWSRPFFGKNFFQGTVDLIHPFDRRRVFAAFDPRDGFLPRSGELGQLLLRQAGRAAVADDIAGQTDAGVLHRRKVPMLIGLRQRGQAVVGQRDRFARPRTKPLVLRLGQQHEPLPRDFDVLQSDHGLVLIVEPVAVSDLLHPHVRAFDAELKTVIPGSQPEAPGQLTRQRFRAAHFGPIRQPGQQFDHAGLDRLGQVAQLHCRIVQQGHVWHDMYMI